MKKLLLLFLISILCLHLHAQLIVDLGRFPAIDKTDKTLLTKDLLEKLNWNTIKEFCKNNEGHNTHEWKDSFLIEYEYVKQGYVASFKIVSYKGMVMEFSSGSSSTPQQSSASYFDKNVWLLYTKEVLPTLPEEFKLTTSETTNILKAYYQLLGVKTRDEYGWICEYSSIGSATGRRMAVIELLKNGRTDLLKKLATYSNLQTKLYAIDALIYQNLQDSSKIASLKIGVSKQEYKLTHLLEKKSKPEDIEATRETIKSLKSQIPFYQKKLLTKEDWNKICCLRDSKQKVNTCGNAGSYKIYQTPIEDLLSPKAISEITMQYEGLKKLGYFN